MAARSVGREQFAGAARVVLVGVRVPAIRLVDRDGNHCPAGLVIIEDLRGESP
ncbi:hypothetical protein ACIRL0_15960 [Streptomyces sp. NPDC102365]|uniref:hypothetical protein n=1 Tax=Streptomyces sp. NPDC102365 TaxID=3366162 RepID=UPI0037F7A80D